MASYDKDQLVELLYQMLETELGGEKNVETAIGASRAEQARSEML